MVKQTRDSNRIAELNQINKALLIFQSFSGTGMGNSTKVYVSIPSDQADCSDLDLPVLGGGYTYACSTSANYRKVDGNGWIPVDLTSVQSSAGTLFAALPIDPVNTVANGYYYTYIPGSWALSATMESTKYIASNAANDGGQSTTRFEVGNEMALNACLVVPAFSATGGTITEVGGYRIHTFTTSGTFTPDGGGNVEVLVVGGGGGGGGGTYESGGGGAGGLIYNASFGVTTSPISVTVGAGGAGGVNTAKGGDGSNSVFSTITSTGGGGGANYSTEGPANNGGSGGGGSPNTHEPGTGISGQGYGGGGYTTLANYGAGGGGGAGAVGGTGNTTNGGNGGVGLEYSQFASVGGSPAGWFAGGGGGSIYSSGTPGAGGQGGGGAGSLGNATSGTANTGGGGGGAERNGTTGGSGGSGIVIVRYLTP